MRSIAGRVHVALQNVVKPNEIQQAQAAGDGFCSWSLTRLDRDARTG
jgi:hypothetical protein